MPYFLVEEHTSSTYGGDETITFHVIVVAKDSRQAFKRAEAVSIETRVRRYPAVATPNTDPIEEPWDFMFSAEELQEAVEGYLWTAVDGSSIWYEVRLLGRIQTLRVVQAPRTEEVQPPNKTTESFVDTDDQHDRAPQSNYLSLVR